MRNAMPETIIWATDAHLDHVSPPARAVWLGSLRTLPGVAMVLTGDLAVAGTLASELVAVADAVGRPLWFVLGNHDHYGGGVGTVRDSVVALAERRPEIRWLPPAGVVSLGPDTALIGVDGWADGRHGDALRTPLILNDDNKIAELAAQSSRLGKLAVKRALADADAARLGVLLERAAPTAHHLIVATHVPPFVEALPREGRLARPEWLPLLVCEATGAVLRRFAGEHPEHRVTVLAGHTHAGVDVAILPNLRCLVGAARYGAPTATSFRP